MPRHQPPGQMVFGQLVLGADTLNRTEVGSLSMAVHPTDRFHVSSSLGSSSSYHLTYKDPRIPDRPPVPRHQPPDLLGQTHTRPRHLRHLQPAPHQGRHLHITHRDWSSGAKPSRGSQIPSCTSSLVANVSTAPISNLPARFHSIFLPSRTPGFPVP